MERGDSVKDHRCALIAAIAVVGLLCACAAAVDDRAGEMPPPPGAAGAAAPLPPDLLEGLTPEQIQQMLAHAVEMRLKMEREQVSAEIRRGLLYDEEDIDAALALLKRPDKSKTSNIDCVCRALAIVDLHFGKAYKLSAAGKHAEAAAAAKRALNPQQTTYLSAAKHYLYAESLVEAGRGEEAVEVYREILAAMPDRISFAAAAAVRAAETYEKLGRFLYAMQMYDHWTKNYGLSADPVRLAAAARKIEHYREIYKEPMKAVAERMGQVKRRLEAVDSGKQTRETQKQIVALLEDLIKTAEVSEEPSNVRLHELGPLRPKHTRDRCDRGRRRRHRRRRRSGSDPRTVRARGEPAHRRLVRHRRDTRVGRVGIDRILESRRRRSECRNGIPRRPRRHGLDRPRHPVRQPLGRTRCPDRGHRLRARARRRPS